MASQFSALQLSADEPLSLPSPEYTFKKEEKIPYPPCAADGEEIEGRRKGRRRREEERGEGKVF